MADTEIINRIREDARDLETRGRKTIRIQALYNYLTELEVDYSDSSNAGDRAKFVEEGILAQYSAQNQIELEFMRAVNLAGQTALRTAILINGGSAIAILAFVGNLSTTGKTELIAALASALAAFVYGTLSGAIATGCTYLAGFLSHGQTKWVFHVLNFCSIFFVFSAYILFAIGGYIAYIGIK
ncbi:MAG: hypothetical protein IH984_08450 [Planctomycetes bacterium]|nr:hypothetical protein [Planctomycetota bacterium]